MARDSQDGCTRPQDSYRRIDLQRLAWRRRQARSGSCQQISYLLSVQLHRMTCSFAVSWLPHVRASHPRLICIFIMHTLYRRKLTRTAALSDPRSSRCPTKQSEIRLEADLFAGGGARWWWAGGWQRDLQLPTQAACEAVCTAGTKGSGQYGQTDNQAVRTECSGRYCSHQHRTLLVDTQAPPQ